MDFLFTGSGLGATAAALTLGGTLALILCHGQEKHDTEKRTHREPRSHAVRISAGRSFASVTTKLRLGFREWLVRNESHSDTVVLLVHGFGEHIGRYDHVARTLVSTCGADVFGFDHQGHGTSEGVRAHFSKATDLVDDAKGFLQFLRETGRITGGQKLFIVGHSMGGLIAGCLAKAVVDGEVEGIVSRTAAPSASTASSSSDAMVFHGLVLSSPFLKVPPETDGPVLRAAANVLSATLPRLPVVALDITSLAADESIREQYLHDPLVYHGQLRARVAQQITFLAEEFMSTVSSLELPSLHMLFGSADRIVCPEGCRMLVSAVRVPDSGVSSCTEVKDGLHELLNDTGGEAHIEEICAFVLKAAAT